MAELVCTGCGGEVDFEGIEPFTLCECSDCGAQITIPYDIDYLRLFKPLAKRAGLAIYEGVDQSHNVPANIYILETDHPDFEEIYRYMHEESVALDTLKHPNICPILNHGKIEGTYFVSTPRMDGYCLSSYAPDAQGLLDIDKVVDILQAAALGLAVAHHKEFVHHDISPESVHIDARGNVRVKNFFISRIVYWMEQKQAADQNAPISVSPFFISPEKAESRTEDKRGDVFSFGVLFYYMLTGQYPFSGRNEVETVFSRVRKKKSQTMEVFSAENTGITTPDKVEYIPPNPPMSIRPEISQELNDITLQMMNYLPVKRPKFTEVLTVLNLYKAKEDQKQVFEAQQQMVTTTTRAIPMMKNLGGNAPKVGKSSKKRFFK